MKILEANAGALTNFEVLDFLRSRGAATDLTRVIAPVAPSEYKVYDYLVASPAGSQSVEKVNEFVGSCKKFNLAKAEVLNVINSRPFVVVDIDPTNHEPISRFEISQHRDHGLWQIIEQSQDRFSDEQIDELVELVKEVFPSLPTETEHEEGMEGTDNQVAEDGEKEVSDKEESNHDEEENGDELKSVDDENANAEP